MDAHALIDFQERQLPGLPGLPGLTNILPLPTPTIVRGRPTPSSASSASASSISSTSSTSASSSSATSSSVSTSSTPEIPTSTPSSSSVSLTTLPPSTHTVTTFNSITPSATTSASHGTSFLQNKVLSSVVFAVAGVIGLTVLVVLLTFVIRRRRNRKLIEDAVSFDPVRMGASDYAYHDSNSLEAGQGHGRQGQGQGQSGRAAEYARSSSSTGRASNGPEVRMTPPFADYAPPPPPSSQKGYQYQNQNQYQYSSPSANMAAYANSYPQQGQAGYDYDYGNTSSQQQQAYVQPFNNTTWSRPSPSSPGSLQNVDPYGGIAMSPPAALLDDVDRSRRRSKSSSTEIKFASTMVPSNHRAGETR